MLHVCVNDNDGVHTMDMVYPGVSHRDILSKLEGGDNAERIACCERLQVFFNTLLRVFQTIYTASDT